MKLLFMERSNHVGIQGGEMKLSEAIEILKDIEREYGGDLTVYIWPTKNIQITYKHGWVEISEKTNY